jgi:hypothetical protein
MSFFKLLFPNILFDILNENPIDMKCIITLIIAAKIKSFEKCHAIKNVVMDGIVIIIAMIVPFKNISFVSNLIFFSFNTLRTVRDNKNQRCFIFGKERRTPNGKLSRGIF